MNLFYFSRNPVKCAQEHCDKHVVKMIVEYGQVLSTCLHNYVVYRGGEGPITPQTKFIKDYSPAKKNDIGTLSLAGILGISHLIYQRTHYAHPVVKWAMNSAENYQYLFDLFVALSNEYTYRYGKVHATFTKLFPVLSKHIESIKATITVSSNQYLGAYVVERHYFYPPPQCVDEESKVPTGRGAYLLDKSKLLEYMMCSVIRAYRNYYKTKKAHFAKWTKRTPPEWFTDVEYTSSKIKEEINSLMSTYEIPDTLPMHKRMSYSARASIRRYWEFYHLRLPNRRAPESI